MPANFTISYVSSFTATGIDHNAKKRSDKTFICYRENKCNHKDCTMHEAHQAPKYDIYADKGLEFYYASCPHRYEQIKCYEVFGIHIIRQYNLDRYSKSGEARIKNLERKIEEMRQRVTMLRRKFDVA
jgi:hypothetical protein